MSHSALSHDEVAVMSSVNYPSNGLGERAFGPKKNSSLYVASFSSGTHIYPSAPI